MSRTLNVAVVGATGLVGREIVALLAEREFPVGELLLFASESSEGAEVDFGEDARIVRRVPHPFPRVDLAFLCATGAVSRELAPGIASSGAVVIDLAGAGLGDPTPERKVLSLPSPLTRLVVAPLQALAPVARLRRVTATLLVSASAFGRAGIDRLGRQTVALLNAREDEEDEGDEEARSLAFNCVPEEPTAEPLSSRLRAEALGLLGVRIPLVVRIVQVPAFFAHAASISLETDPPLAVERARAALREAPSLVVGAAEDPPVSTLEAVGGDGIYVGGLHQDGDDPTWLHLWAVADSIRQGAALAAVALAEKILS